MAREAKYTKRRTVRLMPETDEQLIKRAAVMELDPAVVLRIIVEHSLSGKPIKEGSNRVAKN